jgi:hypothetical protein
MTLSSPFLIVVGSARVSADPNCSSMPNLATADADLSRQLAHAAARDAAKVSAGVSLDR